MSTPYWTKIVYQTFAGQYIHANFMDYHYNSFRIYNNYLVRFTSHHLLEIFDMDNQTINYQLFGTPVRKLIAYDIPQDDSSKLAVVVDTNAYIYNLNQQINVTVNLSIHITPNFFQNITAIEFIPGDTTILGFNGTQTLIQRIAMEYSGSSSPNYIHTNVDTIVYNIKTCRSGSTYHMAIWKKTVLLEFLDANFNSDVPKFTTAQTQLVILQSTVALISMTFSSVATELNSCFNKKTMESESLTYQLSKATLMNDSNDQLDFWFVESSAQFIGVFFNNIYQVYDSAPIWPLTTFQLIQNKTFIYNGLSAYSFTKKLFFILESSNQTFLIQLSREYVSVSEF